MRQGSNDSLGNPPRSHDRADPARVDADAAIFEIASRQHGVISKSQLLQAGVPAHAIEYRLKKARLRRIHRSVYQVGPVAGRRFREAAAVLACGDGSVLSHRTSSDMLQLAASGPLVDVTGPRSLRPRRGIRLHRVAHLRPDEIEWMHGLPITSPARTILDLASCNDPEIETILARAERRGLVTPDKLHAALARHPRARGTRRLRILLSAGAALTRSEAERVFLILVRKGALPRPAVNANVEGIEVDFVWLKHRLVVEIDGFAYHADRESFENDRRRDGILAAAGYRVIRFTWRQLTATPEIVLIRLSEALAQDASG